MSTTDCYNNYITTICDHQFFDVVFHCSDGSVYSQKILLASSSTFLQCILQENPIQNCTEVALYLPDFSKHSVSLLLLLLQHGHVVADQSKLVEVLSLITVLNMDRVVEVSMVTIDVQPDNVLSTLPEEDTSVINVTNTDPIQVNTDNAFQDDDTNSNDAFDDNFFTETDVDVETISTPLTKKTPLKCTYCPREFNHKGNLTRHEQCHKDERPFSCSTCNKNFRTKAHLTDHKKTHTNEKNYQCEICAMQFAKKFSFLRHKVTHTGVRDHVCEICGNKFSLKQVLNIHRRIHTGEKNFCCQTCGKSFRQKFHLKAHMKVHNQKEMLIQIQTVNDSAQFIL